jgi:predicted Zn-dependent protease
MNPRILLLGASLLLLPLAGYSFDFGKLKDAIKPADKEGKAGKALDTVGDYLKVGKGITGIGLEEEKLIGESVALEVVAKYGGLVRDEEITRRVNLVGLGLAHYSDRPDLEWRFAVLNSDTVNAFSTPGGYVFITRGLYALATSDDALAGILGHEIAHITGKHALKIVQRSEFIAGASSQLAMRSSDAREVERQLRQFDLGVKQVASTLFEKGFDPNTEYAADKSGRNLALTTGYAPGALRATLVMLQSRGGAPKTTFSTHPPFAERIKRLPNEAAPTAELR